MNAMMRGVLLGAGGNVIGEFAAPEFITAPMVLRRGERTFLREGMRGAPLVNGDRYREVFCYDLPAGAAEGSVR